MLASLILAICFVESTNINNSINIKDGDSASYGGCQVKYSTAKQVGFKEHITKLWFDNELNKRYALKYLEWQHKRYGSLKKAAASYNSGSVKYNKKGELVNKDYVDKVFSAFDCINHGLRANCTSYAGTEGGQR